MELTDRYAESYQGHYWIIPLEAYLDDFKVQRDAKAYMSNLLGFVKRTRDDLPDDPDLQNIHDEIVGLIAATLYKLTNLS